MSSPNTFNTSLDIDATRQSAQSLNLMVSIPQHGPNGELNDIQTFLHDVDKFFVIDTWWVKVDECLGEGASYIEQISAIEAEMTNDEFRTAYRGIYQTIDGSFVALSNGEEKCRLLAIDSTSWDVSSSNEFEDYMLRKYGGREQRNEV